MRTLRHLGWTLSVCAALAACETTDGNFLIIEARPPPISDGIGLPLRVTAVGGRGVAMALSQATFDDGANSRCLTMGSGGTDVGATKFGTTVVVVHPDEIEALVVGRLYETEQCTGPAELAAYELTVRVQEANEPENEPAGGAL